METSKRQGIRRFSRSCPMQPAATRHDRATTAASPATATMTSHRLPPRQPSAWRRHPIRQHRRRMMPPRRPAVGIRNDDASHQQDPTTTFHETFIITWNFRGTSLSTLFRTVHSTFSFKLVTNKLLINRATFLNRRGKFKFQRVGGCSDVELYTPLLWAWHWTLLPALQRHYKHLL